MGNQQHYWIYAFSVVAGALRGKWSRRSRTEAVIEALSKDFILSPRRPCKPLPSLPQNELRR